jgi:hypothetical protein
MVRFDKETEKRLGIDGIPADVRVELDAGSSHPFGCDCDTCLTWWARVGPEGGEPGSYGPFTKDQVNARQRELGIQETD